MTKEELIKELELLADSCDNNYALEMNGYNRGVLDALSVVNKYFALADVSGRSEQFYCVSSNALVYGKSCEKWCGDENCKALCKQ